MKKILVCVLSFLGYVFASTYDLSDGDILFPSVLNGSFKGNITNPIGAVESPHSWKPTHVTFEAYSENLTSKSSSARIFLDDIVESVENSLLSDSVDITDVHKNYTLPLFDDKDLKLYQPAKLEAIKKSIEKNIKKVRAYLFDFYVILYSPKDQSKIILCNYENEKLIRAKKIFKSRGYACYGLQEIDDLADKMFNTEFKFDFVVHVSNNGILQECVNQVVQHVDSSHAHINHNTDIVLISGKISNKSLHKFKSVLEETQNKLTKDGRYLLIFDSFALIAKGKTNTQDGEKHLILFEEAENEKLSRMIEVLNNNGFNKADIHDLMQTSLSSPQLDKIYESIERKHLHKKLTSIWGK